MDGQGEPLKGVVEARVIGMVRFTGQVQILKARFITTLQKNTASILIQCTRLKICGKQKQRSKILITNSMSFVHIQLLGGRRCN